MFGFGKKNNQKSSVNNKQKKDTHVSAKSKEYVNKSMSVSAPGRPTQSTQHAPNQQQTPSPIKRPSMPNASLQRHSNRPAVSTPGGARSNNKQTTHSRNETASKPSGQTPSKNTNIPNKSVVTAEAVRYLTFVLIASLLLAGILLCLMNGILYAVNHFDFEFGYDVTVKLEDGTENAPMYECDKDTVFREKGKEAYISLSKLAQSLNLSTVGNNERVKFYKTNDLNNYIVVEDGSRHVVINGEGVCLTSPVYITGSNVYVPITFFERYTSSVTIQYNGKSHMMTVFYAINEELSTPKRKVLEEFRFVVSSPTGLVEMTEEERNEYADIGKG